MIDLDRGTIPLPSLVTDQDHEVAKIMKHRSNNRFGIVKKTFSGATRG
jgi:hypothetical protein